MKGKNNPRIARFIGTGNIFAGGRRVHGWAVKCSECGQTKSVGAGGSKLLPPEIVIKKLTQAGWIIGNKPSADVCDACQRKRVSSHIGLAKTALACCSAPLVNGVPFSEVMALAQKLQPEQAKELIKAVREQLPRSTPKRKAVAPPSTESDAEYEQWLREEG